MALDHATLALREFLTLPPNEVPGQLEDSINRFQALASEFRNAEPHPNATNESDRSEEEQGSTETH